MAADQNRISKPKSFSAGISREMRARLPPKLSSKDSDAGADRNIGRARDASRCRIEVLVVVNIQILVIEILAQGFRLFPLRSCHRSKLEFE